MTRERNAIKEGYQRETKSQWKGEPPLTGNISVSITLYFGSKRRADLDLSNSSYSMRLRRRRGV